MKRNFKFKKINNTNWYIILPEWKGDPDDLQMVEGADQWLDLLSNKRTEISLTLSTQTFEDAEILSLIRLREENLGGGGIYYLESYEGKKIGLKLWLCEVTQFVFKDIPQKIYFKVKGF